VGEAFNVGAAHEVSIRDLARRVLELAGTEAEEIGRRIRFVPYEEAYGGGFDDMRRRRPDLRKIRRAVGWEPRTSLDEALGELLASAARER
jgi:UDP-glucose 4-epimerase